MLPINPNCVYYSGYAAESSFCTLPAHPRGMRIAQTMTIFNSRKICFLCIHALFVMGIHAVLLTNTNTASPPQSAHNTQQSWSQKHDEDAREDTQHQRKYDLDLGLCRSLFRPLPPLRSNVFGKAAQRTDDRRAEPVSLRKHAHKGSKLLDLRAIGQVLPGFQPWSSGALLQIDLGKLLGNVRMACAKFLSDAKQCLVQPKARIDADHHKIQRVWQALADAVSPAARL